MSADLAAIVAEAQRLLDGATPGPWTCEPVGYGQHAVIPDARREYVPAESVQRARIAEALAVVATKRAALDAALAAAGGGR